MNKQIQNYKQTDPDNFQFGYEVRGGVYKFKELDRFLYLEMYNKLKDAPQDQVDAFLEDEFETEHLWISKEINLSEYSEPEMEDHISAYYRDLDEVKDIYGDDWMFIVAECIFEQESGLY